MLLLLDFYYIAYTLCVCLAPWTPDLEDPLTWGLECSFGRYVKIIANANGEDSTYLKIP